MFPLHLVLAMKDVVLQLPLYAVIALGVIAAIAFIVGFVKGFRRVKWGGFFCLLAGVASILVIGATEGKAPFGGDATGDTAKLYNFLWVLGVICACVLVSLLVYGILGGILRPKMKWSRKKKIEVDAYGFEYEVDDDCDDPEDIRRDGRTLVKKGFGKPNIFTRFLGGLFAAINAALIVAIVYAVGLLLVDATGLRQGVFGYLFQVEAARTALTWTRAYALDIVSVGIIFLVAYLGWRKGFLSALRSCIVVLGSIALIAFAFYIPFSEQFSQWYFVNSLIRRCTEMLASLGDLSALLGKLLAGLFMAIAAIIAVVLINLLLRRIGRSLEMGFGRVVDGSLGCIVGLVVGAAIVVAVWAGLFVLDYFGLFYVSEIFDESAPIAKAFFETVEIYVKPFVDQHLVAG